MRTLSLIVCVLCSAVRSHGQTAVTTGSFTDASGAVHRWTISESHALLWDDKPYFPVGGRFTPRAFALGATEENWQLDLEALDALKAEGLADVLIDPQVSAPLVPATEWQKLVDALETRGFRYGIGFGAGVNVPLRGMVIRPASYRVAVPRPDIPTTWDVENCEQARFLFVDELDGTQILRDGTVRPTGGTVTVSPDGATVGRAIGLLYPTRAMPSGTPDLWTGYDAYRDRLLRVFGAVKWGSGLRFFVDPVGGPIELSGDAEFLVPDSRGFRLEWEAFLAQRYSSADEALTAWGLQEREPNRSFRHVAQFVPLWSGNKGVPFLLNTATGKREQIRSDSKFWADFREFREKSLSAYLNGAADALKREVANVPVIYTHTQHSRLFTNPNRSGGFDGLGISVAARGSSVISRGAASAYSLSEASARTMWCLVTSLSDAPAAAKTTAGYESQASLYADFEWLRGIGAKGFFLNAFQVFPEERFSHVQLAKAPEQLRWLQNYAERTSRLTAAVSLKPSLLPYPRNAAGIVSAGPVAGRDVWFVPSLYSGDPIEFGAAYRGYTISLPEGDSLVLWSTSGPRDTRLFAREPKLLDVRGPAGEEVRGKLDAKSRTVRLVVGETPVVIRTGGQLVFPIEAAEETLGQLKSLLAQAEARKLPVQPIKMGYTGAETHLKQRDYASAYRMAVDALSDLVRVLQPYSWTEAESAKAHSFTEIAQDRAASGGSFLLLNTGNRPSREGYAVQVEFSVPAQDTYDVWIAAAPPGAESSPFAWLVDTGQPMLGSAAQVVGSSFSEDRFAWTKLGRVPLQKGTHSLTIRVTDRAAGTGRFQFALDTVLVTRDRFIPNGISRPVLASVSPKPSSAGR